MAFLVLCEITAFLASKMQAILQKLIKYQPLSWISSAMEYIYAIYTQKVEQKLGIRLETKTASHPTSKHTFLFHFYPCSLHILYLNTCAGKENIGLRLMK